MSRIDELFLWVLERSWQAALLVLVVVIIQTVFGRHLGARWRAALWLLVVIRLLLPPGLQTSWSLFRYVRPDVLGSWAGRLVSNESPPPGAEMLTVQTEEARAGNETGAVSGLQPVSPVFGRGLLHWSAWTWLFVWVGLSLRLLAKNTWFAWRLRLCGTSPSPPVAGLMEGCRRLAGVRRRLELTETELVGSPALYGLFRLRLLLPSGLMGRLTSEERRYVLLHELGHVKRRDPLLNWVSSLLRLAHWFNPLVWYAFRRLRRDREVACDELVLTLTRGEGRQVYGQTIIRLLELGQCALRAPVLTGILENKLEIERRIRMIAKFEMQVSRPLVAALLAAGLGLFTLTDGRTAANPEVSNPAAKADAKGAPPRIVSTSPSVAATDVDPALTEITVTFDRDMAAGFSWTGGGPDFPTAPEGKKAQWRDRRTAVLPVKLEAARYYRVGINSTSFRNFKGVDGVPANPSAIYFTTRGASEELKRKAMRPEVVEMNPANGAQDVDPGLTELRVTFSVPMGAGFSWTGGGPEFPEGAPGKRPSWVKEGRTCVLPVKLQPGRTYRLGLNSPSHKNFQSAGGVPLDPVVYTFHTKSN